MLIGHEKIYSQLKFDALNDKLHHCQVFIGPKHVGKTKTALLLAMELQCPDESQMIARKQILEGYDADTFIFFDNDEILPIEKIREIIARTALGHVKPYLIFIIENIGRLKIESMNALLKTLEEPPEGTVFFLTANNTDDVIPTIKSRSQITYFQTVNDAEMRTRCGDNPYSNEMVSFAMGRPGKLVRLMNDRELLDAYRSVYSDINEFLENPGIHSAFKLSRKYEKSEFLQELLDILLIRARTFMLSERKSPLLGHLDFTKVSEEIEDAKADLNKNINVKLLLENLLIPFVA